MKFTTSAAVAVAATGAVAQDWSVWSSSSDPATSSTTQDWPATSSSSTADWPKTTSTSTADWPVDPKSSSTTTTGWPAWSSSSSSSSCTESSSASWPVWSSSSSTKSSSVSWPAWSSSSSAAKSSSASWPAWGSSSYDPKVCAATSTETVWEVGTITSTGTSTKTVYTTAVGGWSGVPTVITETDTVTVWVGPNGPESTQYDGQTGGWAASSSVVGGGKGSSTTKASGTNWVYTATDGGEWPATTDPSVWPSDIVSVIGENGNAGWDFTASIPTQTDWTPASPTYTDNCTAPWTGNGETSCNTADNRQGWCDNKDITTDYYNDYPQTGNICSYNFVLTNTTLNFDGDERLALAINGQSPGPLIECNWGDTVQITVTNSMQDNGTSIHWHGIRQVGTNNQDGVPGVTECALAPGQTRTYTWVASSYGTSWYHSHWLTQYGDGLRGPMIIHGPATANYDLDMGTVMVTELFNYTAAQAYDIISHTGPGGSANYLLNGVNTKPDLSAGKHALWQVQPGKKHLFRFINAAAQNMWSLHFDGHTMEVIAVDFVPITPYTTEWLDIAIGQRFDVIITANQPSGNYFLRAVTQTACPSACDNNGLGSANGIIQYEGATLTLPQSNYGNLTIASFATCQDEPISSLVPYLQKTAGSSTAFSAQASTLPAGNVALTQTSDDGAIFRWFLNGGAIDVNYTQPTLQSLAEGNNASITNAIYLNNAANTWVYFVIQNQFFAGHPIHLHGHDFSLLGQKSGSPSPAAAPTLFTAADVSSLEFNNPPRRDTAMLAGNGWTVIGFETDNPGAWLMHCHIVWHVDGGLALEWIERPSAIDAESYVTEDFKNECSAYATYEAASPSHNKSGGESGLRRRGWYEPEWMGQPANVVRRSESHEKRFLDSHLKRGLGDSYKPRHMRR